MTSLNQDMALKLTKNFINLVFIKNLWNFWVVLKPCLDLMMSFKNCIQIRIASFCHPAYYFWRLRRCQTSMSRPCALGGVAEACIISINNLDTKKSFKHWITSFVFNSLNFQPLEIFSELKTRIIDYITCVFVNNR